MHSYVGIQSSESGVYQAFTAYLNLDSAYFKRPMATCVTGGWCVALEEQVINRHSRQLQKVMGATSENAKGGERVVGGGLLENGKMWSFAMDQSPGRAEGSGEGRSPCVHRQPPPDTMLPQRGHHVPSP